MDALEESTIPLSDEAPSAEGAAAAPSGGNGGAAPVRALDETSPLDLPEAERYFNRELSWLRFNERVLEEAQDQRHPLLERVKFLSIHARNLDEFFMIRVSGLRAQLAAGVVELPPDGMTPKEQLTAIRESLLPEIEQTSALWTDDLQPELRSAGIAVLDHEELKKRPRKRLRNLFEQDVFPILTPLAFDPSHPFPHISNLSINLAVVVRDPEHGERFARVKVPQTLARLVPVPERSPDEPAFGSDDAPARRYVWLEQLIAANLDLLFPGLEVVGAYFFRVTRDADFEIEEDEAADLLTTVAEVVGRRHFGSVIRLEVESRMPEELRDILIRNLELAPYQVYTVDGPLGLSSLEEIAFLDVPELRDPPFQPDPRRDLEGDVFDVVRRRDVVLYHPYDSFTPVVDFVRRAAADADVVAIKQTLYRVGANSPIVRALMEARENGKQVSVLVELKARFDEENNIEWARALDDAGVHVVYGVLGLKTHAKMCLVVRREEGRLRSYVHLSTGNYNPSTARVYADIGFLTSDPTVTRDVAHLFNSLTGYARDARYETLLVAPGPMRRQLLERIQREVEHARAGREARLIFKMNSLVDRACIDALYEASQAGVDIDLQVRGICCLRPGVPGLSERIRVTSLVGRFLEHSRIYWFHNDGDDELLLGSADLMPRNLDRRVELLFPVQDRRLRAAVRDDILFRHLADSQSIRELQPDGRYTEKQNGEPGAERVDGVDSHADLLGAAGAWRR